MLQDSKLAAFISTRFRHLLPDEMEDGVRLVYHYTTLDVLRLLTQRDADFICTYCASMNDKAEVATGLRVLEKLFQKHPGAATDITIPQLKEIVADPEYAPWSMSFSSNGDSLNQWIAYTDEQTGGVAVGFDIAHINKRIHINTSSRSMMFLAPCLYERSHEKEIEDFFLFLFGEYKKHLFTIGHEKMPLIAQNRANQYISFLLAIIFTSIIKDESFQSEHEWRLVLHPLEAEKVRDCLFVGGKPRIPTGMFGRDFLLADSIRRIVCSPHGNALDLVKIIVKLRQLNVDPIPSMSTYTTI